VSAYRDHAVLVTGGAGVIGRELIESLLIQGARVMCADLKPRPEWLDGGVEYVEGDAIDLTADRVGDFGPSHVFHLAATFERTEETEGFWEENFHHNVELSHHVATLARQARTVRRLVFASSYLVYDPALYLFDEPRDEPSPLAETDPVRPRNLCGGAKLMHEEELDFLAQFPGTPYTSVSARIFRVYGRGSKDVVSRWVRSLIGDPSRPLAAFRVEGMFDYVYAGDVAEGLLRLGAGDGSRPVNVGSGRARRVSELLGILAERFPGATWSEEPSDIPFEAHQADLARLEETTGWRPPTSLEQGIEILTEHERAATAAPDTPAR
jgi:carbamoyl-phosphate synthase large subunit